MQVINFAITGTSPLLVHNERLANPMDPIVKEMKAITGKRKKSDDDFVAMAEIEFRGGLYHDEEIGPYIPANWIDGTIFCSAKLNKMGTAVKRAVMTVEDMIPIEYKGPRDIASLWSEGWYDQRMTKCQTAKILRTRPTFRYWAAKFSVAFDETLIDRADLISFLENAGRLIGIGDYRPRFGKFSVEVVG